MESNNPFMRNVITTLHMVLLTSVYLHLHFIIEKIEIIKTQTLKIFKKQFQILIGLKHLGHKNTNESCVLLTDALIFSEDIFPRKPKNSTTRPLSG